MVFENLKSNEKDAFFSLLDEYFSSRPHVFGNMGSSDEPGAASAASAVHRSLAAHPETASKIFSAGLKQVSSLRTGAPHESNESEVESTPSSIAGRVAAFSAKKPISSGPPPVSEKPAISGLKSVQKFGSDVDTSSVKNVFGSLRNSAAGKNNTPPPPVLSPAFTPRQNSFGRPPVRQANSSSSLEPPPAPGPPPPPPPPARRQKEEEVQGEWAEALYDYDSEELGDLNIKEGQQVLVTDRSSDDWWTGEFEGKKGLFPASYVKLL